MTLPALPPEQVAALRLAAAERLRSLCGELNPERLIDFAAWRNSGYLAGWVHREIAGHLERFSADVAARRSPRLVVMLPPRHGKSELIARRWLPWHLAHHPTHEVVYATHGQHLADRMSRAARRTARESAVLWPGTLRPGAVDSVSLWDTAAGGSFQAVGIGGPLVGAGAHVLAIDDYCRDAEAAYSEAQRESVWEWYAHVARTRLSPGGGVVVLATPWHEDDLIGRLLAAERRGDGERWEVVRYPAIAEVDERHRAAGEALHPARYDREALDAIRLAIGSRAWAALYQCRPTPATGGLFRREWVRTIDRLPGADTDWEWAISVDASFKNSAGSDFVAMQVWCKARGAHRYILVHAEQRRADYPETRAALVALRQRYPRVSQVVIEEAANGHALIADLRPVIPGVVGYRPQASKEARAQVAARLFESGQVEVVRAPWTDAYVDELCFVAGTMVTTEAGDVPIESVRAGDRVWTRGGWNVVHRAERTSEDTAIMVVTVGDRQLRGTAGHPVWVQGRGFVALGALRAGDPLLCLTASSTEALCFGDTRTPPPQPCATTTAADGRGGRPSYTESSTRPWWAPFRAVGTFITATVTRWTTAWRTWKQSTDANTMLVTWPSASLSRASVSLAGRSSTPGVPGARVGAPLRVETRPVAPHGSYTTSDAGGVASSSTPQGRTSAGARFHAESPPALPPSVQPGSSPASFVEPPSSRAPGGFAVQKVVVSASATPAGRAAVYSLQVEGSPEYFANGLLVHNCGFPGAAHDDQVDATSQALLRWTEGASVQVLGRLPAPGARWG